MTARFLVVLLLIVGTLFLAGITNAQGNLTSSPSAALTKPIVTNFSSQSPQYANLVVINLIHTFSCLAEGSSIIGQPCIEYQEETEGPKAGSMVPKETFISSGGALGSITSLMTNIYTSPPLSTTEYLADAFKGVGISTPAYAQVAGSGNNILSPILPLWKLARNISYLAMIFIFLIIGFMIMFRQKINPQTVISAQSALPGLIVGLILITFSYFIAALVVDVTFVSTRLAGQVFEQEGIMKPGTTDDLLRSQNILTIFDQFISPPTGVGGAANSASTIVNSTIGTVTSLQDTGVIGSVFQTASAVGGCLVAKQLAPDVKVGINFIVKVDLPVGKTIACVAGGGIVQFLMPNTLKGQIVGSLVGLLLYLVLMVALLIAMFKLLFSLITAYVTILISTITAPLQFLVGSIPGRQGALTGWLKTMLGNLMIFPAVFGAMLFAAFILHWDAAPFYITASSGNFSGTVPFLGGLNPQFLQVAFAYGVLLLIPSIPEAIKGAFGIKDNPIFGKAILGGVMGGISVPRALHGKWTAPLKKEQDTYKDLELKSRMEAARAAGTPPKRKFPWIY